MGWKITSVRVSDEDYAALQAEKAATKKPVGTILLDAWKAGKGAGKNEVAVIPPAPLPLPAQTEVKE